MALVGKADILGDRGRGSGAPQTGIYRGGGSLRQPEGAWRNPVPGAKCAGQIDGMHLRPGGRDAQRQIRPIAKLLLHQAKPSRRNPLAERGFAAQRQQLERRVTRSVGGCEGGEQVGMITSRQRMPGPFRLRYRGGPKLGVVDGDRQDKGAVPAIGVPVPDVRRLDRDRAGIAGNLSSTHGLVDRAAQQQRYEGRRMAMKVLRRPSPIKAEAAAHGLRFMEKRIPHSAPGAEAEV